MKFTVRFQRPLLAIFFVFILSVIALGQSEPNVKLDAGNGGRNSLQGDLILPSGQRLDHPVLVRLSTPRGEITTTSNGNGSFVFRQLTAGRYTVTLDAGEGYALASEV